MKGLQLKFVIFTLYLQCLLFPLLPHQPSPLLHRELRGGSISPQLTCLRATPSSGPRSLTFSWQVVNIPPGCGRMLRRGWLPPSFLSRWPVQSQLLGPGFVPPGRSFKQCCAVFPCPQKEHHWTFPSADSTPVRITVAEVFTQGEPLLPHVINIGHSHFSHRQPTTCWQSPFVVGRDGREGLLPIMSRFASFTGCRPKLSSRLHALKSKRLACDCAPNEFCHGDVLVGVAESGKSCLPPLLGCRFRLVLPSHCLKHLSSLLRAPPCSAFLLSLSAGLFWRISSLSLRSMGRIRAWNDFRAYISNVPVFLWNFNIRIRARIFQFLS